MAFKNKYEKLTFRVLKQIFPNNNFIVNKRYDWLRNDKNRKLELDFYSDELKLAVEYNGPQHYHFLKHYHKTEYDFFNQVKNDLIKKSICQRLSIKLIEIPMLFDEKEITSFIVEKYNNYEDTEDLETKISYYKKLLENKKPRT